MATQEIIKPKHEQGLEQISQGLETIKRELETNPQKRRDVETLSALLELIHKKEWSDEEKLEQAFGKAIEVAPDEFIPDELVTIAEHVLSPEP